MILNLTPVDSKCAHDVTAMYTSAKSFYLSAILFHSRSLFDRAARARCSNALVVVSIRAKNRARTRAHVNSYSDATQITTGMFASRCLPKGRLANNVVNQWSTGVWPSLTCHRHREQSSAGANIARATRRPEPSLPSANGHNISRRLTALTVANARLSREIERVCLSIWL